ncbi:MAG: hypothetical protein HC915_16600 [Anaerolineae bacterium]|nr:hypothetical protein [Anaerolineae bacterium]
MNRNLRFLWWLVVVGMVAPWGSAHAQPNIPAPHLGYGIHLDPNVPVDPALVDVLGMDWVKLYADGQIPQFPNKRILFREDMRWREDLGSVEQHFASRAAQLWSQGVDAIEVHNEPNLWIEWEPRLPNAREYTQILCAAYRGIKSTVPNMIVVSGGLAPTVTTPDLRAITDVDFARDMLAAGAGNCFDAFGYHPYGFNAPPEAAPSIGVLNFRRAELIHATLQEAGIFGKQIWLTEFGWLRDPAEDGVACSDADPEFAGFGWMRVDSNTQADFLVRAFGYADRNWEWAGPMFLWNLNFSMRADDISLAACSHQRWFGLLRRDGSATLALERVAAMPKRYAQYLPTLTIYADEMTLETTPFCAGRQQVGSFQVANTGYPGSFSAQIQPASAPFGPRVEVTPAQVQSGGAVAVFVDTSGLESGLYLLYINVRASIGGQDTLQNVRGFVIIQDGDGNTGNC